MNPSGSCSWKLSFVRSFVYCTCIISSTAAVTTITEGPVSVTALIGTNAQFHCAGTGNYLVWEVNGLAPDHPDILARGITTVTLPSSGTVQSNLTVPATSVNNGTTVRCGISVSQFSSTKAISNYSSLTVLPGVGRVGNVRFNYLFTAIMWDPPSSTASTLDSLYYHVIVVNNDTGVVIVSNTTMVTTQQLPDLQRCQYYTANVTAFSSEYHGDSVVTGERSPGEYYRVYSLSQNVGYAVPSTVVFSVGLNLKFPSNLVPPCSSQRLTFQTHLQSNKSDITTHPNYTIVESEHLVFSISAGIERKRLYTATVSLVGIEGVVQVLMLNFSTFAIQHCDICTDHTSYILVECTFAINSTAPGFVLIQDEHSQYTINAALHRHDGDVSKGSVKITDLPTGEYRVTVYDEMEDYVNNIVPYFISIKSLHLDLIANLSTTFILSQVSPFTTASLYSYSPLHKTGTPQPKLTNNSSTVVIVCVTAAIFIGIFAIILASIFIVFHKIRRASKYDISSKGCSDHPQAISSDQNIINKEHNKQPVYAVIQHSANPAAVPPPTELQPVLYAAVKQSTNSSDTPLSSEYDDIGYHVKVMEEAVQEICPTSCKDSSI